LDLSASVSGDPGPATPGPRLRAAIYARVSTEDQETTNQVIHLTGWADALGLEVYEIHQETASAWTQGHQRELSRLIDDAKRGKFKRVLVWSLDRLSRQGPLEILGLVHKLNAWGQVQVFSYQEPWTMAGGEVQELLLSIAAWVAKQESVRRSERTRAGLERKRAAGWTPGRPKGATDKRKRQARSDRGLKRGKA